MIIEAERKTWFTLDRIYMFDKKLIIGLSILILLLSVGILSYSQLHANLVHKQDVKRREDLVVSEAMLPVHVYIRRMKNKELELDRMHISGDQKKRILEQEHVLAVAEYNRTLLAESQGAHRTQSR